jgi:hypothetical protein
MAWATRDIWTTLVRFWEMQTLSLLRSVQTDSVAHLASYQWVPGFFAQG